MGRVLIACEMSAVVRDAFLELGHDAWSCDILPTEGDPLRHIQKDVMRVMDTGCWDLMIGFPPCTYLSNSGVKHLYKGGRRENGPDPLRWKNMRQGAAFFRAMLDEDIPRICLENPIQHKYARDLIGTSYTQVIQPFEHGHGETKKTCLWLKNLPPLSPTNLIAPDFDKWPPGKGNGYNPRVHYESPGVNRSINRSRTLPGIARAMADTWGRLL